ncbi:PD-(D/E)XK nuclease family protein [Thermotoga sp. KOL6]|uniref:PDDEXK-like family protein n=1 Tax=Thermotoga sp. KOL6 TaxID=126741 RepID=UPI000C76AB9B|nr:PD-(D/E)XK nuclease family protein [Thermotoga sp. KOL6]PLV59914.1 hypothetical protein AS005_01060 [Thermotoga sp. KOL6]
MNSKRNQSEREALEKFISDNPELELLEEIIDRFNIFAALNIVNYEIRYSAFLSWLLNPQENHGLRDYFLKIFLKKLILKASILGMERVSVFDIDSWDLDDTEVLREWRNIDILIKHDERKFVCVIENKMYSKDIKGLSTASIHRIEKCLFI